jgi:hypothetical protein
LVSLRRNQLKDSTIEAVELIKNWKKNNILKLKFEIDEAVDDLES